VVDYIKENLHKNIVKELKSLKKSEEENLSSSSDSQGSLNESCSLPDGNLLSALRQGFLLTDDNVIDECRKANDWSGACVCATLIRDNLIYLANLGDSTAVKFQFNSTMSNNRSITKYVVLSKPHKPKEEEQRIETAGGWVSADGYILGVLNCSRAFGDREMKHYDDFQNSNLKKEFEAGQEIRKRILAANSARKQFTRPVPTISRRKQSIPKSNMKFLVSRTPDIEVFNLDENDALLVIASDGLWDVLTPTRCMELVNESYYKRHSLEDVCEILVSEAQIAKSLDDITVMVISLIDILR